MTDKLNAVFTYGTLRPSKEAIHELWGYKMYDYGRFPYLAKRQGAEAVKGNVIYVTDDQLEQLDKYEGVDRGLYTREVVCAYSLDSNPHLDVTDCFVYVATDRLHPKRIPSGDWFNR